MSSSARDNRWASLDILRAVAVLLVMCRHFENRSDPGSPFYFFLRIGSWIGWAGVDLFFALSGFLISNLLFQEFRVAGKIDLARFLARRAFKIYPGFYLLIALTVAGFIEPQTTRGTREIIGEIVFVQNYFGYLWRHTWSLALEEHFYLLMTLLFTLGCRGKIVRRWPTVVAFVAIGCLVAREITGLSAPFWYDTHMQRSHVRIDGLFFGSLAGYLYNYHKGAVSNFLQRRRADFLVAMIAALVAPFIWELERSFFE